MLSQVNQIGTPQIPLALLRQRPAEDWLSFEQDGLEVVTPESTDANDNLLSQIPLFFLRRLVTDDRLRAELEADAAGTLAQHGIHLTPGQIPAAVSLPSPEELEAVLRIHATAEDDSAFVRWAGFLGDLLDDLVGLLDD